MPMLPSYRQLVQHAQQGRSRAGRGQHHRAVINANASQLKPAGTTCTLCIAQHRSSRAGRGQHIEAFLTQMLTNQSQLAQHAQHRSSRAGRGERIAAPPTQMLANQSQVVQHAQQGGSRAGSGQHHKAVYNANASQLKLAGATCRAGAQQGRQGPTQ